MSLVRRWIPLLVLGALALALPLAAFAAPRESVAQYAELGYVPGEVLVKYKDTTSTSVKHDINSRMKATALRHDLYSGIDVVKIPGGSDVRQIAASYRKQAGVEWAEPNYIVHKSFVPDDPLYATRQWNLYNSEYKGINIEGAWDFTFGDPSVIVAVLDTGVAYEDYDDDNDYTYEYLKAPDLNGTNFTAGFDFINNDNHPNDDQGHGTYVTGIIAATTNDGIGCAGIASDVTIMPVKVLDEYGSGTTASVANGIYYAAQHGANVINMSLGSGTYSDTMRAACAYAHTRGVTIIASSGNDVYPGDIPYWIDYPAGFDESVIAVGASTYDNQRAWYTYYGPSLDELYLGYLRGDKKGLDVLAPGGVSWQYQAVGDDWIVVDGPDLNGDGYPDGVVSQTLSGSPLEFYYANEMGTSAAAPHVAGIAALLISIGASDPEEVKDILERTATDLNTTGYDEETGWGLVDAEAAVIEAITLQYSKGPEADAGNDQTVVDSDGNGYEIIILDGSGSTWLTGFPIISYDWKEDGRTLASGVNASVNLSVGTHTIALTCTDSLNRTATDTVIVNVLDGNSLSVARIQSIQIQIDKRKGSKFKVSAVVYVTDALGNPIKKARVTGKWSSTAGMDKPEKTSVTKARGQATFRLNKVGPAYYTFTVTDVSDKNHTYRTDLNVTTSSTLAVF